MGKTRVWYHSACYDGFGSAWAASHFLGSGDDVVYQAVAYGHPPPEHGPDDTVYILDFSYQRETLLRLKESVKSIKVLDHHKTAEESLAGLDFCVFDMKRSGAGMSWDYFNPESSRPKMIDLIEDRDLWVWKFSESRAFHAYLKSFPFDFAVWDSISDDLEYKPEKVIGIGSALLRAADQLVDEICKKSWIGEMCGVKVALVNTASHWSEVGEKLLAKWPEARFSASFTVMPDGRVMWSLRGRGDVDVSDVAKKFGGGGHFSAAGFKASTLYDGTCSFKATEE